MSKTDNLVNSQNDVVTTPTHVLYQFERMIQIQMPGCRTIYDGELSYESALRRSIADDNYNDDQGGHVLPLFAYNRTQLAPSLEAAPGRRMKNIIGTTIAGTEPNRYAVKYGASHSEFDIQFMYLTTSVEQSDKFEVVFESDEGLSGTKELVVNMLDLGDFTYFLTWEDLISRDINIEGQYYKAVMGSVRVRGYYFTFRSTSDIIKELNARIWASRSPSEHFKDELLADLNLTQE